jgi:murein L,D-transpeptidase YcbB/YkuD
MIRGMRQRRVPLVLRLVLAAMPAPAAAAAPARADAAIVARGADAVALAIRDEAGGATKRFYAERGYRPLWAASGRVGRAADLLLGHLESAELDGLKPSSYDLGKLQTRLEAARSGDPRAVARAEIALSDALARYVRDQRDPKRSRSAGMIYADAALKPRKPKPETVLRAAAFPQDFDAYVRDMGWMSQRYVELRTLARRAVGLGAEERARLALNLDRARLLPGPWTHHVVVDASSGRLWYYGAGKQAGTMRVVVGAAATQTPMLAGKLQWAILNPYWNVPTYLARDSIAPKVLAGRSLASLKMEALTDWSADARPLPAAEVDWRAVAAGEREIRLRELPGPANSMGRVKFLFPNREGIYLHDTPERDLLKKSDRHFSNGCIRLEDAPALGRWLMQAPLRTARGRVEQAVPLPVQVPVYLTYLTATATARGVAFRDDVYGRDTPRS